MLVFIQGLNKQLIASWLSRPHNGRDILLLLCGIATEISAKPRKHKER
jgi:hypothetical protein